MFYRVIQSHQPAEIADCLHQDAPRCSLFFTNGIFMRTMTHIVPPTMAAFQYMADRHADIDAAFVLALNSDKSLKNILEQKLSQAEEAEKAELKKKFSNAGTEIERAEAIILPLARLLSDKKIFVIFYDENTPEQLYKALRESGLNLHTLYKGGYGTEKNAPPILGGEYFDQLLASPIIGDIRPVCSDITQGEAKKPVTVVKFDESYRQLDDTLYPYLTSEGLLGFPVSPEDTKHTSFRGAFLPQSHSPTKTTLPEPEKKLEERAISACSTSP